MIKPKSILFFIGMNMWYMYVSIGTAGFAIFFIQPNLVRQASLVFSCVRMGSNALDLYVTALITPNSHQKTP